MSSGLQWERIPLGLRFQAGGLAIDLFFGREEEPRCRALVRKGGEARIHFGEDTWGDVFAGLVPWLLDSMTYVFRPPPADLLSDLRIRTEKASRIVLHGRVSSGGWEPVTFDRRLLGFVGTWSAGTATIRFGVPEWGEPRLVGHAVGRNEDGSRTGVFCRKDTWWEVLAGLVGRPQGFGWEQVWQLACEYWELMPECGVGLAPETLSSPAKGWSCTMTGLHLQGGHLWDLLPCEQSGSHGYALYRDTELCRQVSSDLAGLLEGERLPQPTAAHLFFFFAIHGYPAAFLPSPGGEKKHSGEKAAPLNVTAQRTVPAVVRYYPEVITDEISGPSGLLQEIDRRVNADGWGDLVSIEPGFLWPLEPPKMPSGWSNEGDRLRLRIALEDREIWVQIQPRVGFEGYTAEIWITAREDDGSQGFILEGPYRTKGEDLLEAWTEAARVGGLWQGLLAGWSVVRAIPWGHAGTWPRISPDGWPLGDWVPLADGFVYACDGYARAGDSGPELLLASLASGGFYTIKWDDDPGKQTALSAGSLPSLVASVSALKGIDLPIPPFVGGVEAAALALPEVVWSIHGKFLTGKVSLGDGIQTQSAVIQRVSPETYRLRLLLELEDGGENSVEMLPPKESGVLIDLLGQVEDSLPGYQDPPQDLVDRWREGSLEGSAGWSDPWEDCGQIPRQALLELKLLRRTVRVATGCEVTAKDGGLLCSVLALETGQVEPALLSPRGLETGGDWEPIENWRRLV